MLISIETHITCDFPGRFGPPIPPHPLDPHMATELLLKGSVLSLTFAKQQMSIFFYPKYPAEEDQLSSEIAI